MFEKNLQSGYQNKALGLSSLNKIADEVVPHWSDEEGCYCSRDHWILYYRYLTGKLEVVCRLPSKSTSLVGRLRDHLARSRLRTAFFPGPALENVVRIGGNTTLIVHDQVYIHHATNGSYQAKAIPWLDPRKLFQPLRGGIAVHGESQKAYFGEYLDGRKLGVRIYRIDAFAETVEVCWVFKGTETKHVHSIHYDRFRNRLWICTGDLDHESSFYFTDDEFKTVQRFCGGDQSWRAISILFDANGMEWGMDAGKDAPSDAVNLIYRYDFSAGRRSVLATISNPAYAATQFDDGTAMMQTTFEPGRPQDTPAESALWFRDNTGQWKKYLSLPYASKPRKGVSLYGSIYLPQGNNVAGRLLFTPVNCGNQHSSLVELRWPSQSVTHL